MMAAEMATGLAAPLPASLLNYDLGALHALAAFKFSAALVSDKLRVIETCRQSSNAFDEVFIVGKEGKILFRSSHTAGRFASLLNHASAAVEADPNGWISDVFPELPSGRRSPLLVRLLAHPSPVAQAVIIVVVDLNLFSDVSEPLLRSTFGLTSAEALLAAGLSKGTSLQAFCNQSHIRISTGRTQLAGVLAKTNTSRQSDLISLLIRLSVPGTSRHVGSHS